MDIESPSQVVDLVIQRQLAGFVLGFATLLADIDNLRVKWYVVHSEFVSNREHVGSDTVDGYSSSHL